MLEPIIQQQTDEELMEGFIHERNTALYTELYRRHFRPLARYLSWLIKDEGRGKDLAQNIFIQIYHKPNLFDTRKNFKVWLFAIAKNRWKNEVRDEAVKTKYIRLASTEFMRMADEGATTPSTQHQQRVRRAMAELTEPHREVVILKYTNNLTIQEISDITGNSKGTVKSRLFYALKHLRSLVNERL